MIIPIVNEKDEIIGNKDRSELNYDVDIFRSSSLWITNSNGDVLLAQRKLNKKVNPGKWGEAVGGTVDGNDSYYETATREAQEELGLKDIEITKGPKQFIDAFARYFVQWYTTSTDKSIQEFKIQEEEVEQIAWVPISRLCEELKIVPNKYVDDFAETVQLLVK